MSPTLFILSITCYLISVVAGLTAAFFIKQISQKLIIILILLHGLALLAWIVLRNESDIIAAPGISNYLFLAFFCSGMFLSGMVLRATFPLLLKIYFTSYLLSLPFFIIVPSRVLGFIASGNIRSVNPQRFHISENYYVVGQQSSTEGGTDSSDPALYKVIREMGMFHKTLSRDVQLPSGIDSINLLNSNLNEMIQLRVFYSQSDAAKIMDVKIVTGNHRDSSKDIKQIRK